jgi:hypothetical protein
MMRNAEIQDLIETLRDQHARKVDLIIPAKEIVSEFGKIRISGAPTVLGDDGVTDPNGLYAPTAVFDETLAAKLDVPAHYLRRLRETRRQDLIDANINGLLHGEVNASEPRWEPPNADQRSFMLRLFTGGGESDGVARAALSDRYGIIDNIDVLMASLEGMRATGTPIKVEGCDLSDRRMYMRVSAPEIQALAPELLKNYRSPFTGDMGADNPTVFAGFVISNSEVGGGAFTVTPRLVIRVCTNGMTVTKDALRAVHLGGKQDDGLIRWGQDTARKQLELVKLRTRDAVRTFLDVDYMTRVIADATERAGKPVEKPVETIKSVGKTLGYSKADQDGILDHFIKGADATSGGLMQAVTSYAQTVGNADTASDLEGSALRILSLV